MLRGVAAPCELQLTWRAYRQRCERDGVQPEEPHAIASRRRAAALKKEIRVASRYVEYLKKQVGLPVGIDDRVYHFCPPIGMMHISGCLSMTPICLALYVVAGSSRSHVTVTWHTCCRGVSFARRRRKDG
jgi:hypothetical protein